MEKRVMTMEMPKDKRTIKYIKDGKRKMMSSDGVMMMDAEKAKKVFGNQKQGRYSLKQK